MATGSLREQNKQRTFERIKEVARRLFEEKGYEHTTTREVAEAACIGTGTLFLYARDKAELLILVYADSMREITGHVFATIPERMSLLDALMHVFNPFFDLYGQHPENARHFLKELLFHSSERRGHQEFEALHVEFLKRLAHLVRQAQDGGEIRRDVDPRQAAACFFAVYFAAVTAWLGSFLVLEPSESGSLDPLRALFELQIRGMLPEGRVLDVSIHED
jgi:AcrR family transcriptional regulator